MKVVKEGRISLPVCCLSPPRTALLSKQLLVGTRARTSGIRALGVWPFCSEGAPTPKTCSRKGAGWSLAQLPWAPLLLP